MYAPVAQRIEHRIPVPRVGGSNPFWRTIANTHEPQIMWVKHVFAVKLKMPERV